MGFIYNFAFVNEDTCEYGINGDINIMKPAKIADCNFLTAIYREKNFSYPKFFKMDELSKAGFLVSEMLLENFRNQLDCKNTGVIFFNRESSLYTDRNFENTIKDSDNYYPSPSLFVYTLPNIVTGEICIRNKFMGESSFYVLDYHDEQYMADVINDALVQNSAVVCGWSDMQHDKIRAVSFVATREPYGNEGIICDKDGIKGIFLCAFCECDSSVIDIKKWKKNID